MKALLFGYLIICICLFLYMEFNEKIYTRFLSDDALFENVSDRQKESALFRFTVYIVTISLFIFSVFAMPFIILALIIRETKKEKYEKRKKGLRTSRNGQFTKKDGRHDGNVRRSDKRDNDFEETIGRIYGGIRDHKKDL